MQKHRHSDIETYIKTLHPAKQIALIRTVMSEGKATVTTQTELDDCIVWNVPNTVFGSNGAAIYAQTVYFLHSTRPSVT